MTIWFATGNTHKKQELAAIFGNQWRIQIPMDAGLEFDPEETGSTFPENARIKARALHDLLHKSRPSLFTPGDPVIADDSGLCVDALNGRPGIYSARYAGARTNGTANGTKLSAQERNALLLAELADNPVRTARFVCAMVLFINENRFCIVQETLEGEIVKSGEFAKGSGGFGYDPILYIPGMGRTVAELSETEKNTISHRGKAGKMIAAVLGGI